MKEFKYSKWFYVVLGLLTFILGLLVIDSGHEFGDDFALYLAQAKNLFEPHQYRELIKLNTESMRESDAVIGPFRYPVGFPFFLAILGLFMGFENLIIFKIILFGFFVFSLVRLLYVYSKDFKNNVGWFIVCSIVLFSPKLIESADRLLSDLLFSATVFLFFSEIKINRNNVFSDGLLIILLTSSILIRPTGLILALSLFFYWWKREKFSTRFFVNIFSTITVIGISQWIQGGSDTVYLTLFSSGLNVTGISHNLLYYSTLLVKIPVWNFTKIIDIYIPSFSTFIYPLFFMLILYSIFYKLFTKITEEKIFILIHLAILIIWPSQQGPRLIFPIFPLYIIVLFSFLSSMNLGIIKKVLVNSGYLFVGVIVIQGVATAFHYVKTNTNQAFSADMNELSDFITKLENKDCRISFFKPRLLAYRTDKKVFRIQNSVDYSSDKLCLMQPVILDSLIYKNINYYVAPRTDYNELLKDIKSSRILSKLSALKSEKVVFINNKFVVFDLNSN